MKLYKPKFSIVIPVYKTEKFLDKVYECIEEQDYKNYETIIVVNKTNSKVIEKAKKHKSILVEIDKDKGAPYARNRGADVATGDILIFLDSDSYLNPGILTTFVRGFRDNPDAGFLYADYEFIVPRGDNPQVFRSQQLDKYALTCNNYINTMSPIKRDVAPRFDESLKSLQDWDFFWTAVDNGVKGVYLEGVISFKTEPVRDDSVSYDSFKNWIKRRTTVREKHGIEDRKIAVISLGAPHHALATAKILKADYYAHPIHKENKYELVYLLGFYPQALQGHIKALLQNVNKDAKKLIHWIGTDVFQMHNSVSWAQLKDIKKMFKKLKVKHFTEFKTTYDELREQGIKTEIVPLPPDKVSGTTPLPKEFSVGVYINPSQDMYYEDHMYDIARSMPDIKFKFFGNKEKAGHSEDNMHWVGYVDMDEFINETSCILRITKHDGLPLSPVQFFLKGRDVVTNVSLDYAYIIDLSSGDKAKSQIVNSIRQIKLKNRLNRRAATFYRNLMSYEKFVKKIYAEL